MALGGAALGALSNKKDRKKGALMGLGAGLLGPAIGAMGGAGAAVAAPLSAAAGTAGTAAAGTAAAGAGTAALGTAGTSAAAAVPAAAGGGGMAGFAKTMAPMLLKGAMPKEGPPPPQAGQSMAIQNQGNQPQANLYNQAMVNQQERMKRRNHTRGMR